MLVQIFIFFKQPFKRVYTILTGINSLKQCGEYYFRGIMYTQVSASKHDKKKKKDL